MIKDILKTLKINHYVKNLIVLFPLFFSMKFTDLKSWFCCLIIFCSFCAVSSSVYIFNDLIDIKKDKLHPIKKQRPIASGKIPKPVAVAILALLFIVASVLAFCLNPFCVVMVVSYFILNIFYSFILKNIALIDAACIATGFIFRIIAGCCAIKVMPSALVILLTFFISMFFTFTKRKLEFQLLKENDSVRKSIQGFNVTILDKFILINAILSVAFYITYVLDPVTIQRARSEYLFISVIPFTLIIFRLLFLIDTKEVSEDPIVFVEKDIPLKWLFALYILVLLLILVL